jgi:alpha,alpha-trehalase
MAREKGEDAASLFPPRVLREYALLAGGERGAPVGLPGDIAWMCAARWHSDHDSYPK